MLKIRNDRKLSEANFHARLSYLKQLLKNIHAMMLAPFLFTFERIFTPKKNPQNETRKMTDHVRTSINQEERRRDKTPAHTICVQSVRASVSESQVVEITPV